MKKRNLFKAIIGGALAISLVGCGGSSSSSDTKLEKITVAASPTPHAEILAQTKSDLKKQGYDLQVKEFNDYVQPNTVVEEGDYDANYFQHTPYLENFNKEKGTHLVSVGKIHYEPFGVYPGKKSSFDALTNGDTIAVPNDATNEARALLLLAENGVIDLKDKTDINATTKDITSNPKNINFKELEAAQISRVTKEVDLAVMNGNYALDAGFDVKKDAIAVEKSDSTAAKTYANVLVVKKGNEKKRKIQALYKELKSDKIKKFINDKYKGAVVPFEG